MTDTAAVTLTPAEKKALKAQAHALDPVVLIGDKGLTPNVVKEIDMNLNAHGLIKVRVAGDDREARLEYAQAICDETGAALVQHIGKLLVLFRPKARLRKSQGKKPTKTQRSTPNQASVCFQRLTQAFGIEAGLLSFVTPNRFKPHTSAPIILTEYSTLEMACMLPNWLRMAASSSPCKPAMASRKVFIWG